MHPPKHLTQIVPQHGTIRESSGSFAAHLLQCGIGSQLG